MSDTVDTDGALVTTELEERAGAENLEELHAKRRKLLKDNARLIALHGPFGLYDNFRKKMVSAQIIAVSMNPEPGIKPTDKSIDAMAHATPQYATFLDTALAEKIRYLEVANEITELEERIRNREEVLRAHRVEAGLR